MAILEQVERVEKVVERLVRFCEGHRLGLLCGIRGRRRRSVEEWDADLEAREEGWQVVCEEGQE